MTCGGEGNERRQASSHVCVQIDHRMAMTKFSEMKMGTRQKSTVTHGGNVGAAERRKEEEKTKGRWKPVDRERGRVEVGGCSEDQSSSES